MDKIYYVVFYAIVAFLISLVARDAKSMKEKGYAGELKYITFDNHEYVIWNKRGGLTHSPKCSCLTTMSKNNNF